MGVDAHDATCSEALAAVFGIDYQGQSFTEMLSLVLGNYVGTKMRVHKPDTVYHGQIVTVLEYTPSSKYPLTVRVPSGARMYFMMNDLVRISGG